MGNSLFSDFHTTSDADWIKKVKSDLKIRDLDELNYLFPLEEIELHPYYFRSDKKGLKLSKGRTGWKIRAKLTSETIGFLNSGEVPTDFSGIDEFELDLDDLFPEINKLKDPDKIGWHFSIEKFNPELIAKAMDQMAQSTHIDNSIGYDPISTAVTSGNWPDKETKSLERYSEFIKFVSVQNSNCRFLVVNGNNFGNSGASAVQELAFSLGQLNEYLIIAEENGYLDKISGRHIEVRLSIGGNYFMELSKFRAARILISNILDSYGLDDYPEFSIAARSNHMNFSAADADTNLIRSTTACMSAAIGGSDSILIAPHTIRQAGNNLFGERLAKNLQLILKHEANLHRVSDPAAGSYLIEHLSLALAEKGWSVFKDLETSGGLMTEFAKGKVQDEINRIASLRKKRFRDQSDIFVGLNKYQTGELVDQELKGEQKSIQKTGEFKALKPMYLEESN